MASYLPHDVLVIVALTKEYGGVRPANTRRRKLLIEKAIRDEWIEPRLLNGAHPITLRMFKIFASQKMGPCHYGLGAHAELKAHNDEMTDGMKFVSLQIPRTRNTNPIMEWCFQNDVCAYPSTRWITSEESSGIHLYLEVLEEDLPLLMLRWTE